ncbi:MAG: hypothetical protein HC888_10155, partial [Candidatus Competibacteraceae bacterium]|nr:hypothetical protein [Candidatus Competibacteraceae bacterium]
MRLIESTGYRPSQDVGIIDSIEYFNEPQRINRWDRLTASEAAWLEQEIEKCRDSFSYLARNYFRIVTKQKGKYFEFLSAAC